MEAVLKIGGSLSEYPKNLMHLCQKLSVLAERHKVLIVPGGGKFADTVRKFDKIYGFSETVAHKMAILAMDQYGLLLSDITPNSHIVHSLKEISKSAKGILPIFLPSNLIFLKDPIEHSWEITSDSIAAYIANAVQAKKLVLVTDVDGIFPEDPKQKLDVKQIEELAAEELQDWNKRTSVDKTLPEMLLQTKLDCYIVNGTYPERVELILENKKTIYTHITV